MFDISLSPELGNVKAVRLLITKKDLFEKAVRRKLLPGLNKETYPGFEKDLFGEVGEEIRRLCKVNHIDDFEVVRVNATDIGQTFRVLRRVLAACERKGDLLGA